MSTLLAKAITFKSLIKQLSKQEFLKFMGKIYDINHSDLISTTLFNHFINPPSITNPNTDNLNNINSIISTIIQSRKVKPKQLPSTNIKFDQFPKALIGHISSFLKQNEYFQFEKTNRSVFIGCNSPNMLMELDLCKVADYSSINLSHFKSLNKLKINLSKFHQFPLPQNGEIIMNQLVNLFLYGQRMSDMDIEPFMNQNCINIKNIKTLQMVNFRGRSGDRFNKDKFLRLLTLFKNVEYLGLYAIILRRPCIDGQEFQELYNLYPNLKALSVDGGLLKTINDFVNIFGNNLQFLLHGFSPHPLTDFSNINFNKLEQVVLETPSVKIINQILKTGQNIKHFRLLHRKNIISPSPQELKIIIPQIFKCKSLQYFEIAVNDENYVSVLDGIEIGLYKTKTFERKQMKIRVKATKNSQIDLKSMMLNIGRIIRWLESAKINDFMFICDMRSITRKLRRKLKKDTVGILNELNEISSNVEAKQTNQKKIYIITNNNCKMCGWSDPDPWMFHM